MAIITVSEKIENQDQLSIPISIRQIEVDF
jgi:hypothetical protein